MRNIQRIIDINGGIDKFPALQIHAAGFMRLCIERIGQAPDGSGWLISVAHYYEQHGDLVSDPDMVFRVYAGKWEPVSFEMGALGMYQEALEWKGERCYIRRKLSRELRSFAHQWNRNIRDQGFVKAAEATREAAIEAL